MNTLILAAEMLLSGSLTIFLTIVMVVIVLVGVSYRSYIKSHK
jgi:hypothetical protein